MDGPIVDVDRGSATPIGAQLVDGLRQGVLGGSLRPGDPVPSTRALASTLGISRSVVVTAYDQLVGEGYLETRQGAATRVAELGPRPDRSADAAASMPSAGPAGSSSARSSPAGSTETPPLGHAAIAAPAEPRINLLPGRPSTSRLDTRAWRAAWRRAATAEIPADSPPPFGVPRLRVEIADHLRHARGLACSPDDVVVTAGTSEALGLVASVLADLAGRPPVIAIEHPGYPSARRLFARRGARTAPLALDRDGFDVGALRRLPSPPDAVLVTPSHQYPIGGRLPVSTRLDLIGWARTTGGLVIEDDYDSEFRHLGPPLPALASLDDGGRVVLVGSFSKVLTPWIRLGYLVLPPANRELREAIAASRDDEACPVPGVAQHAIAELLASGAVRRHIAVVRREYAHRRGLVLAALDGLPAATLSALDGGLHAVVELPDAAASAALVTRLASEGVAVAPLSDYSAVPGDGRPGIVFGYAAPSDTRLVEGLARIRSAILDLTAAPAPAPATPNSSFTPSR
ncbi:GntR family transcriptional regulator/MocR family aminotransferase [Agromyces hippuratus]|uniref:GntR family transcriptional regulator/MocR family aminotransferase n=1 Tax=Agromyces hippuratus TaxID=286438 RepID=A0A852WU57_9MICO|nr:PLP-dependent aminotransferase family protein [Agromyces hippuratus]NYG21822.1 GntR family transcriptional regulator/MocR family aminotransferase [Agromyces hippuratus]